MMILLHVRYPRKRQIELGIPDDFRSAYTNFVSNLVVLRKNGGTLQSFEEDLIKEGANSPLPNGLVELTKIVLLTFERNKQIQKTGYNAKTPYATITCHLINAQAMLHGYTAEMIRAT
eukprot:767878-Hanusia_phi.AAC.2